MTLPRATSATARAHKPKQRHWLGHALKFMTATFLNDEQTSDLTLHSSRD
jgi:hypothetical protein